MATMPVWPVLMATQVTHTRLVSEKSGSSAFEHIIRAANTYVMIANDNGPITLKTNTFLSNIWHDYAHIMYLSYGNI